jgi:hypothetical protein
MLRNAPTEARVAVHATLCPKLRRGTRVAATNRPSSLSSIGNYAASTQLYLLRFGKGKADTFS